MFTVSSVPDTVLGMRDIEMTQVVLIHYSTGGDRKETRSISKISGILVSI